MKKIAITQRLIKNDSYYEIREALDVNYSKLVRACGFLPIVLPYKIDFKDYMKELDIQGVILTGGNDLNSVNKNRLSETRDNFEYKLIEHCVNNQIPLFGICRGMQIIAEYFGSTFKKITDEIGIRHELKVNKETKYLQYLEKLKSLNSFHDFTIDKISDDLLISGTDKKGVIKAVEHRTEKIFAQMWHPEREKKFSQSEIDLIKVFFN
jgi:putative glutamine amidotransferase